MLPIDKLPSAPYLISLVTFGVTQGGYAAHSNGRKNHV